MEEAKQMPIIKSPGGIVMNEDFTPNTGEVYPGQSAPPTGAYPNNWQPMQVSPPPPPPPQLQYYYQPPASWPNGNEGKGTATASLVCGIISVAFAWFGYGALVGLVLGILALVFAVSSRKKRKSGVSTAGLVLGIIGTALSGIAFIACFSCVNVCAMPLSFLLF